MAQQPNLRRRDRGNRLDEDYMAAPDYGYDDSPPRHYRHDSPPRRSHRQQRARSPDYGHPPPRYESPPRRTKSTRDDHLAYGKGGYSPPRQRRRDVSPEYERDARRAPPGPRRTFPEDHSNDRGYGGGYGESRGGRRGGGYDEPEPRPRRGRYASPSPERRPRGGRAQPAYDYDNSPPRRHRSMNGREPAYGAAAPGGRGSPPTADRRRPPPATAGRPPAAGGGARPRRNSMPTAGGPPAGASAKAKAQWWQNPMLQATARTAFTAGAHAAYGARKEKGDWMGPKGFKVAQAALMGGVVDGFMNKKRDQGGDGGGGGGGRRGRSPSPPPRRSGGGGGGSDLKSQLMNAGVQAAMGHFANRR